MAPCHRARAKGEDGGNREGRRCRQDAVEIRARPVDEFAKREAEAREDKAERTPLAAQEARAEGDKRRGDDEAADDASRRREPALLMDVADEPRRAKEEQNRRRAQQLNGRDDIFAGNPARTPLLADAQPVPRGLCPQLELRRFLGRDFFLSCPPCPCGWSKWRENDFVCFLDARSTPPGPLGHPSLGGGMPRGAFP